MNEQERKRKALRNPAHREMLDKLGISQARDRELYNVGLAAVNSCDSLDELIQFLAEMDISLTEKIYLTYQLASFIEGNLQQRLNNAS